MVSERKLAADERALLLLILEGAPFPGAGELRAQVQATRVVGGIPAYLDLYAERSAPQADCEDGPIPGRAIVEGAAGELEGEVLVWVKDGYLSGLEFAWLTDETPQAMPPPERIRLERTE